MWMLGLGLLFSSNITLFSYVSFIFLHFLESSSTLSSHFFRLGFYFCCYIFSIWEFCYLFSGYSILFLFYDGSMVFSLLGRNLFIHLFLKFLFPWCVQVMPVCLFWLLPFKFKAFFKYLVTPDGFPRFWRGDKSRLQVLNSRVALSLLSVTLGWSDWAVRFKELLMIVSFILFLLSGSDYLPRVDFQSPVWKVRKGRCQNI